MAYDEGLAQRVREALADRAGVSEKKMFGGLCFLVRGNMCCGIVGDELMLRVGPEMHAEALSRPHAREMNFTGRPMRGMAYVGTGGIEDDAALAEWIEMGVTFATSLEPK